MYRIHLVIAGIWALLVHLHVGAARLATNHNQNRLRV